MLLKIDKDRAVLHTRMTPAMMGLVPRLEGRRKWLKGGGLSLEATQHNIDILKSGVADLEISRVDQPDWLEDSDLSSSVVKAPYKQKTKPYPHQIRALAAAEKQKHFALFMEQGTGKTKVAIDRAGGLWCNNQITGVLVVAPKGVHRQWVDSQLPAHCGTEYTAHHWPLKELPDDLVPGDDLKWLTINVDGMKTPKGKAMCLSFINHHQGRVLMIVDESHLIKNSQSQRWKAANALGRCCSNRMILTGTPIAKDLTEEWAQLKWLDENILGIRYMNAFRNEYCIMGGFEGRVVIGNKNLERFREKVDPYTFRSTKEELGILPKVYDRWMFDMTIEQKRMIKTMRKELIAQIDNGEIVTAQNAVVSVLRMQQISNGFLIDDDKVVQPLFDSLMKNPRIASLKDLLESIDSKVVIWAHFHYDIEQIKMLLGDDCVLYYGKTKEKDRVLAKQRFMKEDSLKYFVGTPASAGTGTDGLQEVCSRGVYYCNSDNSINRWQSEDRIDRIGMAGASSHHTDMVAPGSNDAKILNNLRGKKSISEMGIGDLRNWLAGEDDDEAIIQSLNEGDFN